jgi:hypothetical protein
LNNRKNQNSILVLATLGVYLGLVLAGATPQVWAQSATAKQFSLKDETERQNDLDNKPDTPCNDELLTKIRELEALYPWFNDYNIHSYAGLVDDILDASPKIGAFSVSWKSVGKDKQIRTVTAVSSLVAAEEFLDKIGDDVLILGNGLSGRSFSFSADRDDSGHFIKFESKAFPYDQPLVRYLYGAALEFQRCSDDSEYSLILRNTEVRVQDRNLIITTRLARGSLDSLYD